MHGKLFRQIRRRHKRRRKVWQTSINSGLGLYSTAPTVNWVIRVKDVSMIEAERETAGMENMTGSRTTGMTLQTIHRYRLMWLLRKLHLPRKLKRMLQTRKGRNQTPSHCWRQGRTYLNGPYQSR